MDWEIDAEVQQQIEHIVRMVPMSHIRPDRVFCYRTTNSKSRAYARIWSFPKIFQDALAIEPAYVIEVLSQHYDKLSGDEKVKVLIHELLHIPKNFSGSLLPHKYGKTTINREIKKLFTLYNENRGQF